MEKLKTWEEMYGDGSDEKEISEENNLKKINEIMDEVLG